MSISDILIDKGLLQCSFSLIFNRIHHVNNKHAYLLPSMLVNSFYFKFFSKQEQKFLISCNTYNDFILSSKERRKYNIYSVYSGMQLIINMHNHDFKKVIKFSIDNMYEFTKLCRKYKTPMEAEKIITTILKQVHIYDKD